MGRQAHCDTPVTAHWSLGLYAGLDLRDAADLNVECFADSGNDWESTLAEQRDHNVVSAWALCLLAQCWIYQYCSADCNNSMALLSVYLLHNAPEADWKQAAGNKPLVEG